MVNRARKHALFDRRDDELERDVVGFDAACNRASQFGGDAFSGANKRIDVSFAVAALCRR